MFPFLLMFLALFVVFFLGFFWGIHEAKRAYGIGKGVTPEEYDNYIDDLCAKAYGTYQEVE